MIGFHSFILLFSFFRVVENRKNMVNHGRQRSYYERYFIHRIIITMVSKQYSFKLKIAKLYFYKKYSQCLDI